MPKLTADTIGVALDMFGCPSRCRHCRLGNATGGRLSEDDLRWVVGRFRDFQRERAGEPSWQAMHISTWAREPDYSDDYRHL